MIVSHRSRIAIVVVAAAVVALGLLGGCAARSADGAPVATSTVDLPPSYKFEPAAITVKPGTTVTWKNDDHFTHSVQFLDGVAFVLVFAAAVQNSLVTSPASSRTRTKGVAVGAEQ